MKKLLAGLVAALIILPLLAGPGRGGGSSSSGSRSSSSSSSSRSSSSFSSGSRSSYGSYGSQRSTPSTPSAPSRSYGSFSKPSTPAPQVSRSYGSFGGNKAAQVAPSQSRPQAQAAWARSQQASSAAAASKANLTKFKAPATPAPAPQAVASSPVFGRTVTTTKPTYQTYSIQRQTYYRAYTPPVYVYNYAPRYGMWDAMFMWMMLDSMNHQMYYHHRNDADYRAWRADADRQAQNDAAVKAKLQQMDAKIKELEAQKTPVNPAYMPEGVDPSVAMAQDVAEKTLPQEAPAPNPDTVNYGPRRVEEDSSFAWLWWTLGILTVVGIGGYVWYRSSTKDYTGRYGF